MKIYKLSADFDNYDACGIDYAACSKKYGIKEDYDMNIALDGSSVADSWWPRIMKRYNDAPLADYISKLSSDVIIMRRESIEKIEHLFCNYEILPLICDFGDYWAINIMDVLDCVDYEHSEFKRFPQSTTKGTPRIMRFIKFAFIPDKLCGFHVFKIPDLPKAHIFVDEVFVNEVSKCNITGFDFKLVWEN